MSVSLPTPQQVAQAIGDTYDPRTDEAAALDAVAVLIQGIAFGAVDLSDDDYDWAVERLAGRKLDPRETLTRVTNQKDSGA